MAVGGQDLASAEVSSCLGKCRHLHVSASTVSGIFVHDDVSSTRLPAAHCNWTCSTNHSRNRVQALASQHKVCMAVTAVASSRS